ncbi:MAG: RIP metalloprotease RseP [Cyclobacteriaceae bacterium]
MMEGIIMTAQLLLGLSILVGLHEFGHLIAAKAFGMRVEKYSIGFPPKIWGKQIGETEYSFGAIPLGGFVKISGMIDESMDTEAMSAEPQPWEFRSKPAWQRLIVMMGGIIVNVITGVIIFIAITYNQGDQYLSKEELNKYGIVASPIAEEIGLQSGDKIFSISGKEYDRFSDLTSPNIFLDENVYFSLKRGQQTVQVTIPNDFIDKIADNADQPYISFRYPFNVGQIMPGSPADKAGLEEGDQIIGIDDESVDYFDQLQKTLKAKAGDSISLKIARQGEEIELKAEIGEDGLLGFQAIPDIEFSFRDLSFGEAAAKGTEEAFGVVFSNIKAFGKMFKGDASVSKSLSGPIGIARIFGGTWDWGKFWRITGLLSMVLAFMNFLPIPALDGGHVVFLTYEIVSGRKPSDKFLENAQKVGMLLLLGIMAFAIFNDIIKFF